MVIHELLELMLLVAKFFNALLVLGNLYFPQFFLKCEPQRLLELATTFKCQHLHVKDVFVGVKPIFDHVFLELEDALHSVRFRNPVDVLSQRRPCPSSLFFLVLCCLSLFECIEQLDFLSWIL